MGPPVDENLACRRRVVELPESGDYVVHDFMHESVIVVRQDDGSLKAYYNTCGHRGQRLVWNTGSTQNFHCPYHGWVWARTAYLPAFRTQRIFRKAIRAGNSS